MNRKHAWIPIALLVGVLLAACKNDNMQASSRDDPRTGAEAGVFEAYGLIPGNPADLSLTDNQALGTCSDNAQFFAECEAPLEEPLLPTLPEARVHETLCVAARHASSSPAAQHSAVAHPDDTAIAVQREPVSAAATLAGGCGKTGSFMSSVADADRGTTGDATVCSCGMKLCGCG